MAEKVIRIFTMPQEFPCGEGSSCCGPIGQTEEEIAALKSHLESAFGLPVEVRNVKNGAEMRDHRKILALIHSMGWGVLPILALGDEVVSIGAPTPEQAEAALRPKIESIIAS